MARNFELWKRAYPEYTVDYGQVPLLEDEYPETTGLSPDEEQAIWARRSLLRFVVSVFQPEDQIKFIPIDFEHQNELIARFPKWEAEIRREITPDLPKVPWSRSQEAQDLIEDLAQRQSQEIDAPKRFNDQMLGINTRYRNCKYISRESIDKYLQSLNLPVKLDSLPILQQVALRMEYPYAWIGVELPKKWVNRNDDLLDDSSKWMDPSDHDRTGINTVAMNSELDSNWRYRDSGTVAQYRQFISILNQASPLPNGIILFRGISIDMPSIGDIIEEYGFSSKTYLYHIAATYTKSCCILIITYPPWHKFFMPKEGYKRTFEELVSYPGERLRVDRIDGNHIYCHFIGYNPHKDPNGKIITIEATDEMKFPFLDTGVPLIHSGNTSSSSSSTLAQPPSLPFGKFSPQPTPPPASLPTSPPSLTFGTFSPPKVQPPASEYKIYTPPPTSPPASEFKIYTPPPTSPPASTFATSTQPPTFNFGAPTQPPASTFATSTQPPTFNFGAPTQPPASTFATSTRPPTFNFGAPTQSPRFTFGQSTVQPPTSLFGTFTQR